MARPDYRHSRFGIAIYQAGGGPLYRLNAEQLFTPGSTTKLFTEGAALTLLGPTSAFTRRSIAPERSRKGTLKGDLILVASGDPNISDRIQPDGSLAFVDEDHTLAGGFAPFPAIPSSSCASSKGGRRCRDQTGHRPGADRCQPVCRRHPRAGHRRGDLAHPGQRQCHRHHLQARRESRRCGELDHRARRPTYHFVNKIVTVEARQDQSRRRHHRSQGRHADGDLDRRGGRGFRAGDLWLRGPARRVLPARYSAGVEGRGREGAGKPGAITAEATETTVGAGAVRKFYTDAMRIAEHVSPPLSQDVRITLKMSQNLHASTMPYVLGAQLAVPP